MAELKLLVFGDLIGRLGRETVAKLEIPMQPDHIPPRFGFNAGP